MSAVAFVLWIILAASIVFTIAAVLKRSARLILVASIMSFFFSFLAVWSIGPLTFLLTTLQIALYLQITYDIKGIKRMLLIAGALVVWAVVLLYVGNPLGLKQTM